MAADEPWLRVVEVSRRYGAVLALDHASVTVAAGEIRGLVGANGAGKSTLVKILTGMVAPDEGRVIVDGEPLPLAHPEASLRAGIVAVPQELTVAPAMTVAENVMLGRFPATRLGFVAGRKIRRAASQVLESLGLDLPLDLPVGALPHLEQRLVMIARALKFDARLMIFDEPTAAVSPAEVGRLLGLIRDLGRQQVSVLFVSHHLEEVEHLCTTVTVLRDGRVVADLGPGEVTRGRLVELLTGGVESAAEVIEDSAPDRSLPGADVAVRIRGLEGERLSVGSLDVRAGEILGLAGLAGSGARELLLTIMGAARFHRGTIEVGSVQLPSGDPVAAAGAGVAYLPGNRALGAFSRHSIQHNVALSSISRYTRGPFVDETAQRSAVVALLERVALTRSPSEPMSALSGGNQQRALVARTLMARPKVLLLDDPTAGVDVRTRPDVYGQVIQMCAEGTAVLLLSSDEEELAELADRAVVFERGRLSGSLEGRQLTPDRLLEAMTGAGIRSERRKR